MARVTLDSLAVLIACFWPSPQFHVTEREVVMKFGVGRLILHGSEVMNKGIRVLSLARPKNSTVVLNSGYALSSPGVVGLNFDRSIKMAGGFVKLAFFTEDQTH